MVLVKKKKKKSFWCITKIDYLMIILCNINVKLCRNQYTWNKHIYIKILPIVHGSSIAVSALSGQVHSALLGFGTEPLTWPCQVPKPSLKCIIIMCSSTFTFTICFGKLGTSGFKEKMKPFQTHFLL